MSVSYAATMEKSMVDWKMRGGNYPSICDSCHMLDILMDRDEDLRGPYLEISSNH